MDAGLGRRTDALVSAQALGPKWVRINRRMEAGGMIDRQASTRVEGWSEGRLRDWAGDDKCFMFVSLNMRVSQRVRGESKFQMICHSASFCVSLSELRERCVCAHKSFWFIHFEVYIYTSRQVFSFYRQQTTVCSLRGRKKCKVCDTERGKLIRTQDD